MEPIEREYPRRQKKIKAMVSIHVEAPAQTASSSVRRDRGIRLMAETKDISWSGFCLKFAALPADPENRFSPSQAHTLVGRSIRVKISKPLITLWGDVVRFDSRLREMAVIITRVSDYDLWQQICGQETSQ
ncbi:MAG TPA: hypothetical protein PLA18_05655 [Deltaproteobacteria bacterium]|nr:hypothetical protein [Deltaproteobacteria bacterium]